MDYGKAIFHLIESIECLPNIDEAYNKLGEIYLVKNEYEKSMLYLKEAYERLPESYIVLNNVGLCLFNLGDFDNAGQFFAQSIRQNYKFPRSLNNLGNTMRKKNDIPKAIHFYEQAVKVHNLFIEEGKEKQAFHIAHLNLATAYIELDNIPKCIENLNRATAEFHKTITKAIQTKGLDYFLKPRDLQRAIDLYYKGDYQGSRLVLDKIYELSKENPVVNYFCAAVAIKTGQCQQTQKYGLAIQKILDKYQDKLVCKIITKKMVALLHEQKAQQSSNNILHEEEDYEDEQPSNISMKDKVNQYNDYSQSHIKNKQATEDFQHNYSRSNMSKISDQSMMSAPRRPSSYQSRSMIDNQNKIKHSQHHALSPQQNFDHPILQAQTFSLMPNKKATLWDVQNKNTQNRISVQPKKQGLPPRQNKKATQQINLSPQSIFTVGDDQNNNPYYTIRGQLSPADSFKKNLNFNDFEEIKEIQEDEVQLMKKTMLGDYFLTAQRKKKRQFSLRGENESGTNTIDYSDNQRYAKEVYDSANNTQDNAILKQFILSQGGDRGNSPIQNKKIDSQDGSIYRQNQHTISPYKSI